MMRMSVLRALAQSPERARAYDGLEGSLLELLPDVSRGSERLLLLGALCAFEQGELLWGEFLRSDDQEELLVLASRLRREPWIVERLSAALPEASWQQQKVIATMLCPIEGLSPALEVRVACLATLERRLPPLDAEVWPVWQELLPLQKCRALLKSHPDGPLMLKDRWSDLSRAEQRWVLEWLFPDPDIVALCLESSVLRRPVLEMMAGGDWGEQLKGLWDLVELRPDLVKAGLAVDLERHPELRAAAVARSGPEADWEALVGGSWRVRSAALSRIVDLGLADSLIVAWRDSEREELALAAAWLEQNLS